MNTYRCPTSATHSTPEILGCGAFFNAAPDDEGLIDCPHCGIWFRADEPATEDPFYPGILASFNSEPGDAARYFDNIAGLFISRQFSFLELRDDIKELTDLNL